MKGKKYRMGKMSGDRLMCASKMADEKVERAIKPLQLSKIKGRIR